jgi:ion channel-forming bestrophin family protein
MVTYNPKDWIKLIVHLHKSDTLRILLPAILLLGFITAVISYIEQHYLLSYIPTNLTVFHQISGFIISLVLVFRINSAYDRWWEGRKLWGSLLNNSRNLALKLNAIIPQNDVNERKEFQSMISNYAISLKEHLRGNTAEEQLEYSAELKKESYLNAAHKPNYIAKVLTNFAYNQCKKQSGNNENYLLINANINELTDICGACERIKNTPIPYAYSIFIKKLVFVYIITMPVAFGLSMGYWSITIVMVMFYAFASLELISEEIEDPFGTDDNDLPTDDIAEKIKLNTIEILFP